MSTLIAITYDTADKATQALEKLGEMQKMQLVTLEDAAVVDGRSAARRCGGGPSTPRPRPAAAVAGTGGCAESAMPPILSQPGGPVSPLHSSRSVR